MSSLNTKLSNSIKFLREFNKDATSIYEDCLDMMKEIDKRDPAEKDYQDKLRKMTKKFTEDMNDFIKQIDMDYELFKRDFPDIKSSKHDDIVIYSLRDYLEYSDEFKALKKKKYEILLLKLQTRLDVSLSAKDYGRYLGYHKVYVIAEKIYGKVGFVKQKCDEITGEKNKDDE